MARWTREEAIAGIEAAMGVPLVEAGAIHELDLQEIWGALEGAILMERKSEGIRRIESRDEYLRS